MTTKPKPDFTSGFQNLIIQAERGGVRKTAHAKMVVDIALSLGASAKLFEIDQRSELAAMYPTITTHIALPASEAVQEDDHAEIRCLSPVLAALTAPGPALTVVDVGANLDARVAMTMVKAGIAGRAAAAGRSTVFLIPFLPEASSVQAAASSAKRAQLAMPKAKIVFCLGETGSGAAAMETLASSSVWKSTIQPHVERHGLMRMPRLTPGVLGALLSSKVTPLAFTAMSDEELAPFSDNNAFIAGANRAAVQVLVASMAKEYSTFFDFRRD